MEIANFINRVLLEYTEKVFSETFSKRIVLINEEFSNDTAGMGFFEISYNYPSKNYKIIFEYEKIFFTIRVIHKNTFYNFFADHTEFSNDLTKENIEKSISTLKEDIDNNRLIFYYVSEKGQLKKVVT